MTRPLPRHGHNDTILRIVIRKKFSPGIDFPVSTYRLYR